mgnify:CR=1 FL=1
MKTQMIALLLCLCLIACGSNANSAEPTAIPTITPFPTNTPTPMPTEIPDPLGDGPEFNIRDTVVAAGQFAFQVSGAETRNVIGSNTPMSDRQFLIIDGILYNYADSDQTFYRSEFAVTVNDRVYEPQNDHMRDLQANDEAYEDVSFPRNRNFPDSELIIPAHNWEIIFLVYELPAPIDEITLNFSPANLSVPATMGLWLIGNESDSSLAVYKVSQDGEQTYEINFEFVSEEPELEELIDPDIIVIDNCGPGEVTRSTTVTETITPSVNIGATVDAISRATGLLLGNPTIGQIVSSGIAGTFNIQDTTPRTVSEEISVVVPPNTRARYQVIWYRVNERGVVQINVGGDNIYVPYEVSNDLEISVEALPSESCDE